jgi:uncharacterized protein with HEPN domain
MQPESAAFLWDVRAAGVRITNFAEGHGYAVVDDAVVWSAVPERMPALLTVVENLLDEIG